MRTPKTPGLTLWAAAKRWSKGKEAEETTNSAIFGSIGVKIRVLWAYNPKGKEAQGAIYHKTPNTTGYHPVGGLRKLIKRPRSKGDTQFLTIFGSNGVQIGV